MGDQTEKREAINVSKVTPDSEEELSRLVEYAPTNLTYLDLDLRYLFVSKQYAQLVGLPRERLIGRPAREIVGDDSFALMQPQFEIALSGRAANFETALPNCPDGRRLLKCSVWPDVGSDGTVRGVYVFDDAASETERNNDELTAKDRRLQRVLDAANIIPWEADPQTWRFTYVGSQAERMLGYPLHQWYEQDFWTSTIFPEDREFAINYCATCSKTLSDFEFEYRMVKADGNVIWLRDIVNVDIKDGVPQILRGFMFDNTETKRMEHLYSVAPIGLCYFDSDLKYRYVNEWLARINGLPVQAHLGEKIDDLLKEVAAGVVPQLRHVLDTGEPILEGEVEAETPAHPGEPRHYMHNFYPDTHQDGTVSGVSCVVQDITDRKRAEETLQQAHDHLEAHVQDRTQVLRALNEELKAREMELQKNAESLRKLNGKLILAQEDECRRIGRELHDDLTQNLAAIAIDAGRMEQKAKASEGRDVDGLRKIKERIIELSEYVHTLSRRLHPAIVGDLGIDAALRSLCEELDQNESLMIDYESDTIPAEIPNGHALCVYRVAQEALRNIVKHSRATRAQIHLDSKNGTLQLQVRDNGVGFNLDQANNHIGLGLHSIEERAWQVGGTVRMETGPGDGTVISLSIPLT